MAARSWWADGRRMADADASRVSGIGLVQSGVIAAWQLEEALSERRETGRSVGEILIGRGWVSKAELAGAAAGRRESIPELGGDDEPALAGAGRPDDRKFLGEFLVEHGLLTQADVDDALAIQKMTRQRLGAILVSRRFITMADLTRVIAEQHGLDLRQRSLRASFAANAEPTGDAA
jgi:hypothetical protein